MEISSSSSSSSSSSVIFCDLGLSNILDRVLNVFCV